jgi:hypothetical protein
MQTVRTLAVSRAIATPPRPENEAAVAAAGKGTSGLFGKGVPLFLVWLLPAVAVGLLLVATATVGSKQSL